MDVNEILHYVQNENDYKVAGMAEGWQTFCNPLQAIAQGVILRWQECKEFLKKTR